MLISTASNDILFSIHGVGGGMFVNMKMAFVKLKTQKAHGYDAFKRECSASDVKLGNVNLLY
jgi:hypothetical protein